MTTYFTHEDSWTGGFYELAIDVGSMEDAAVLAILQALWSYPGLEGCYLERGREPADQLRLDVTSALLTYAHLQGIAQFPDGNRLPCGTYLLRDLSGTNWVDFYIPAGALERVYDLGGYPFSVQDAHTRQQWQQPLDLWFAELGQYIFDKRAYQFAAIGHEVAAEVEAAQIAHAGIPERRWMGYLWPTGTTLTYWPRTMP
jgi:hypothetical protein